MKKIKTIFTMMAAAIALFLLPEGSCISASAEESVTYVVKYIEDMGEWRYQTGASVFNDEEVHRELYYMYETLKDGDLVVVYNGSASAPSLLSLGNVRLKNLTVVQTASFTSIATGGVDECYILAGNSCGISGNVSNAHVYGTTTCNFDSNVQELNVYAQGDEPTATVGCSGTVYHYCSRTESLDRTFHDLYNFREDSFLIQNGVLQVPESMYSTAPTAQTPAPTPTPQQPESPSTGASDDDEYDDVPKTGNAHPEIWLVCLAGIFFLLGYGFKKSESR